MEKINLTNLILFSSEDKNGEIWNLRAVPLYKVWRVYIEWNDFSTYYNEGNEFSVCCFLDISNWIFSCYFGLSETSHLIPLLNEVTSTISAFPFLIPFPNLVTGITLCYCNTRRKWHPTPVFLPGESCGWRSLVSCCPWGHTELDTTEAT